MLSNFCFNVWASNLLDIGQKCLFLDLLTLNCDLTSHWAGSQLPQNQSIISQFLRDFFIFFQKADFFCKIQTFWRKRRPYLCVFFKKCLNVRQKLGTWKFFNVFLRFPMFSNVFQCYLLSFSLSLTISLSHYLTLSHSHTLSISHWITLDMLNNFCFHLYAQKSLSHSHALTLTHSLTLTLFQSLIQSLSTCWTSFVFISMLKSPK